MIDFAYARLNLRFNPFGELDRQRRIENAVPRCDFELVKQHLQLDSRDAVKSAVQFIGDPGSGKSTHLLMLASQQADFRYIHIPMNCRRSVPVARDLMVDEAQRLTGRQRASLFKSADRIVLGTHRCFRKQLHANGFAVQTVSLDSRPDADWLHAAWQAKIASARRSSDCSPDGSPPEITRATVVRLINEFGCNIRGMERQLYESIHSLNQEMNLEMSPESELKDCVQF